MLSDHRPRRKHVGRLRTLVDLRQATPRIGGRKLKTRRLYVSQRQSMPSGEGLAVWGTQGHKTP
ncbi:hypothetical protein GCM10027259_16100 [Micromonospora palomenae]